MSHAAGAESRAGVGAGAAAAAASGGPLSSSSSSSALPCSSSLSSAAPASAPAPASSLLSTPLPPLASVVAAATLACNSAKDAGGGCALYGETRVHYAAAELLLVGFISTRSGKLHLNPHESSRLRAGDTVIALQRGKGERTAGAQA